jgi:hypothetical protein
VLEVEVEVELVLTLMFDVEVELSLVLITSVYKVGEFVGEFDSDTGADVELRPPCL